MTEENSPALPECTPFEREVVREYTKHGNRSQAYRTAAKKFRKSLPENVSQTAGNLLKDERVKRAIDEKLSEYEDKADISHLRVLSQDRDLAFSDVRDLFHEDGSVIPPHMLPDQVAKCVKKITKTTTHTKQGDEITTFSYEFWDKHKALDRLFRYMRMGPDHIQRNEHTGKVQHDHSHDHKHTHRHQVPTEAQEIFERITGRSFHEIYDEPTDSSPEEGS